MLLLARPRGCTWKTRIKYVTAKLYLFTFWVCVCFVLLKVVCLPLCYAHQARFVMKYRHADGQVVLKVTDDVVVSERWYYALLLLK